MKQIHLISKTNIADRNSQAKVCCFWFFPNRNTKNLCIISSCLPSLQTQGTLRPSNKYIHFTIFKKKLYVRFVVVIIITTTDDNPVNKMLTQLQYAINCLNAIVKYSEQAVFSTAGCSSTCHHCLKRINF